MGEREAFWRQVGAKGEVTFPVLAGERHNTAIPTDVAEVVYEQYAKRYSGQSMKRIAERGGFGMTEVAAFLWAALVEARKDGSAHG